MTPPSAPSDEERSETPEEPDSGADTGRREQDPEAKRDDLEEATSDAINSVWNTPAG